MAAEANNVEEMMNSPEIKPNRPIMNTVPVKMSFCRSFMSMSSYKIEMFFKLRVHYTKDPYC